VTVLAVGTRRVPLRAAVRGAMAVVVLIAVAATFFDTASREAVNPFNFFGFFTMQSNIAAAVVLLLAAVLQLRDATDGWVPYPFLDPATGYPSVVLYVVGIAASIAGFGALVILISRSAGSVSGLSARIRRTRG
jgi:hypothetical protein